MTCSDADEACPFIRGAEKRFLFDMKTQRSLMTLPLEEEKYNERSIQIASEMDYLFSKSAAIISGNL
ncbi:MAG: hypothetical protein IPJ75_15730 [Ignavibacteriales bacterium]|nr:hypothetical protein [Ignavibacteriales bacterium]